MIYFDDTDLLIDFSDISIASGKVVTGWFYYIDWSDEVPVGWVQGGYMSTSIGGVFQSVPYQVTIIYYPGGRVYSHEENGGCLLRFGL